MESLFMPVRRRHSPDPALQKRGISGFIHLALLLLTMGSLTVIAGCFLYGGEPHDFYSGSEFQVRIETSEPITNATFYLPLPVKNGIPKVGEQILSESDFGKTGFSINFTDSPPGLVLTDAYTVPDNRPQFVCIRADIMKSDSSHNSPNTSYEVDIDKIDFHYNPRLFYKTLTPIGNESGLIPKFDFSPPPPVRISGKFSADKIVYKYMRIPQSIPVFADYSANPSVLVSVTLSIHGYNGWRQETTSHSNAYTDSAYWGHTGESHGWQYAHGDFTPGVGVYPNPSHPLWQNVMKKYQMEGT